MEVSPDKAIRVEQTSPIGRIPVSPENAAGLKNGDFLVATVEQVRGDMLLLRADGGFLLNAALQGQMSLFEGDVIEAAVSKDGGRCLLYILNVLHTGTPAAKDAAVSATPQTLSAMLAVIKRNPGLDADTALFLAANNIPDTAENIAALAQMSRGTGIGALLGQILGMATQPEEAAPSGAAQAMMPAGDVPPQQGETGTAPAVPGGSNPQTGAAQPNQAAEAGQGMGPQPVMTGPHTAPMAPGVPQTEPQQGTATPVPTPEAGMAPGASDGSTGPIPGAQTGEPAAQRTGGNVSGAQAGPLTSAPGTVRAHAEPLPGAAETIQPQADPQRSAPANQAPPHTVSAEAPHTAHTIGTQSVERQAPQSSRTQNIAPEEMAAPPDRGDAGRVQGADERIGQLIRGLFLRPGEKNGAEMKRTAEDMTRGLKALKSELIQTDIKYRELCLKSADQALRQLEMSDRAAHFEHMQIPFAVKEGEHRTAELYVFRRNGGQKQAAEAGLSILVALDTEHMGRVETMIRETGGSISLEFRLERPGMTETFKGHSVPLQKAVEAAGYKLTDMRFAGLEKKTTVLNAGEMVSLDAGAAPPGIDVQV